MISMINSFSLLPRQIHLDFHTSPFIPGVGENFDADIFAQTMAEAHVQSVNIFAKCHHGMSYYPTRIGTRHPYLKQTDLLGEMIEALHRRGIRAPVYTTVVWEERVADTHPEWRQMKADGTPCQLEKSADMQTIVPGRWRFNSFVHPEYQDYFEAHLLELLNGYDIDGLWIDILFLDQGACFNPASIHERERLGLMEDSLAVNSKFESLMQQKFCSRFTKLIHDKAPRASVFYNSTNHVFADPRYSWTSRVNYQTHCEIESLPSGFWGYYHFPKYARQAQMWDKPFLGMTGRFQKMWGDFGGIKPQAALEYECFRMQALGGGCSVGDQMHPSGKLDQGAYHLIGKIYEQIAAAEPFYAGTVPCPQGAVLPAGDPGQNETLTGQSEEGAVLMLEELHYDVAVVDWSDDLNRFDFLILTDSTPVDEMFRRKLEKYYNAGGKLILSHRAGFNPNGEWALKFLPLRVGSPQPLFPTYWKTCAALCPEYADDFRVIYQQGLRVEGGENTTVPVERHLPYFKRSDEKFCSHFQTPADPHCTPEAAVVAGERFVYFADPVFTEYRQSGNTFVREIFAAILETIQIRPYITGGLHPHVHAYGRRDGDDLKITLINYIPCRKSLAVDIIETPLSFAGQSVRLSRLAKEVCTIDGVKLNQLHQNEFMLPETATGRLLLTAKGFFTAPETSISR